jgi:hypothetical protein
MAPTVIAPAMLARRNARSMDAWPATATETVAAPFTNALILRAPPKTIERPLLRLAARKCTGFAQLVWGRAVAFGGKAV